MGGGIALLLVVVVLVLGFWQPGFFVTTKLDVSKAQAGVQQVLSDETNGYGAKNVKDVKCNHGQNPTVKKGATFDCDVSIDGAPKHVTVTFQDNKAPTRSAARSSGPSGRQRVERFLQARDRRSDAQFGRQLGGSLRIGRDQR